MKLAGETVLVVGACGMFAGHLIPLLKKEGAHLVYADTRRREGFTDELVSIDITKKETTLEQIKALQPRVIFNCAAYTAVDDAEDKVELTLKVNAIGPRNLALAAKACSALLVHISSDYVYGGDNHEKRERVPYVETDEPSPCGVYGHSKWLGDEFVQTVLPDDHLILRISWLHGLYGPNFVATIARVAKERDELKVVNDQIGSPTWAQWLAEAMVKLVRTDKRGLYHACSHGDISWYDFARGIVEMLGLKTKVSTQTTAELQRKARRPFYSTMNVQKLEAALGERCPSWREGLAAHLEHLKG